MGKRINASKKSIDTHINYWRCKLGLYSWKIDAVYYEGNIPDATGPDVPALIHCDWRYMSASISFSLPLIKMMDDKEIEQIVIHELFHAVVNEMKTGEQDHEERVVTMLTKIVGWIRDA